MVDSARARARASPRAVSEELQGRPTGLITHSITRASEWPLCAAEVGQRQKEGGRRGRWRPGGEETQTR